MPVNSRLAHYDDALEDYRFIRHCLEGERSIKGRRLVGESVNPETYLPRPSGFERGTAEGDAAWNAYLERAEFPDIVDPTLRGLLGVLLRKPCRLELPARMEYLRKSATPDGLSFWEMERQAASDQIAFGRHALLPELNGQARICCYAPERLINWRTAVIDGVRKLTLAVIEEKEYVPSPDDPFLSVESMAWLVLQLEKGRYTQQRWIKGPGDEEPRLDNTATPDIRQSAIEEIPLVVLGAQRVGVEIDKRPLLGLCNTALDAYQISADGRHSLFMTASPTPYVTGMTASDPNRPTKIGPSAMWFLPDVASKAGLLQADGDGGANRQAELDRYQRASLQGAQMLETEKRAAETAEALRLRQNARHATLQTIASVLEEGINRALVYCAKWNDVKPETVIYEPNTDFVDNPMDSQDLKATIDAWIQGGYGPEVLYHRLKDAEILPDEMSFEDYVADRRNALKAA